MIETETINMAAHSVHPLEYNLIDDLDLGCQSLNNMSKGCPKRETLRDCRKDKIDWKNRREKEQGEDRGKKLLKWQKYRMIRKTING